MNKQKRGRKFSRKNQQRKAMIKSLISSLFLKEKIKTTEAKAKEAAPFAEKAISRANKGGVQAIRILNKDFSKKVVQKLIQEIAPLFNTRKGGYTRIIKTEPRKSDGARMAIIELVEKTK